MISVDLRAAIRHAYYHEHKSVRQIARALKCSRKTVDKAIDTAEPTPYSRTVPRDSPKLGAFHARIDELLAEQARQPRKQRYTSHKIFEILQKEGYTGSESRIRGYIGQCKRSIKRPPVFLPLEFDPGQDAQVDWGEAIAILAGERLTVQLFVMRLCYSRRTFAMAFPTQRQEAFFDGHVRAFHFFQGVPHRLSYDNLTTAIRPIFTGRTRQEQQAFTLFRSHYLFASHFCTPNEGHEKGQVEHGVGYVRRNFLVPLPEADSFAALNELLLARCRQDDARQVHGLPATIGALWAAEQPLLRALPAHDLACCVTVSACLTPYSQVIFETNRYSVPVERAATQLVIKAYPFQIEILHQNQILAQHPRCYDRETDVFDPLHYLALLEQRPGAFEHAKPIRRWRENWPLCYKRLLHRLREQWPEGRGIREFVRILKLHQIHPAELIEQAIEQALTYGCVHAEGVTLCLHQLLHPEQLAPALDLTETPHLAQIGAQPIDFGVYEALLTGGS